MSKDRVKVYGFKRAGNNYLMYLIAQNFYPNDNLQTIPKRPCGMWYQLDEDTITNANPYGKLFGSHKPVLPVGGRERRLMIYISRDLNTNLESYLAFMVGIGYGRPNPEKVTELIINHWRVFEDCFQVKYEDLVASPIEQLERIQNHFELSHEGDWLIPSRKIGWNPRREVE